MPGTEMRALSTSSADLTSPTEEKKPACKACCACPQTKQARDLCIMENGEAQCQGLIEAHKECMRSQAVPRILSHDELLQLVKHDSRPIPDFKRLQLEKMVDKNWDKFYRRNANRFFKPRHWTSREFEELGGICSKTLLFEVGCGVGDLVFPLVKENPSLFVYACDFSPLAIDLLKNNPEYSKGQVDAFVADASEAVFEQHIPAPVDMATLIFVLSAINPSKWRRTLKNIRKVIKPSGLLLFRDYGLYDHAMIRFGPGQKLGESFYFRHDGTYTYFFATEEIRRIFTEAGFVVVSCDYVFRETTNKKEDLCVPRIFIQAKFRVPAVRADAMSSPTAQT